MPTLLVAVNECLLSVGELEVNNLTTPVARKAVLAIKQAMHFIPTIHAWRYFRNSVAAVSWVGGVATLPPFQECYEAYDDDFALRRMHPVKLQKTVALSPDEGSPYVFATVGENRVLVHQQPNAAKKLSMRFDVLSAPTIPAVATDVLAISDPLYQLVALYAQAEMHRIHTGDIDGIQAAQRMLELQAQHLRTRDNLQPVSYMGGF